VRWAPWAAALGSVFAAASSAGEAREPIRVEYSAHPDCPDARFFLSEVLSRSSRLRGAPDMELARVLRVSITRGARASESKGEISLLPTGEQTPVRFSATGACEDVIYALAQFAALSLDSSVKSLPTHEVLPPNPYLSWKGPVATELPENPYRSWDGPVAEVLPQNPYRQGSARQVTPEPALPANPYRPGRY